MDAYQIQNHLSYQKIICFQHAAKGQKVIIYVLFLEKFHI